MPPELRFSQGKRPDLSPQIYENDTREPVETRCKTPKASLRPTLGNTGFLVSVLGLCLPGNICGNVVPGKVPGTLQFFGLHQ
jgi:hypothetical protein